MKSTNTGTNLSGEGYNSFEAQIKKLYMPSVESFGFNTNALVVYSDNKNDSFNPKAGAAGMVWPGGTAAEEQYNANLAKWPDSNRNYWAEQAGKLPNGDEHYLEVRWTNDPEEAEKMYNECKQKYAFKYDYGADTALEMT